MTESAGGKIVWEDLKEKKKTRNAKRELRHPLASSLQNICMVCSRGNSRRKDSSSEPNINKVPGAEEKRRSVFILKAKGQHGSSSLAARRQEQKTGGGKNKEAKQEKN